MMRLRFIIIIIVLVNTVLSANVDSLLRIVAVEQQDTHTVNALIEITRSLRSNFPDSAEMYAQKALFLAQNISFQKGENNATFQLAVIHYFRGDSEKALKFIEENKEGLNKVETSRRKLASTLIIEGNIFKNLGDYTKAIEIYDKCLKIAEEHQDSHLWVVVNNNKANIYRRQGRHGDALKIYFEALKICEDYDLESDKVLVLGNIGLVYKEQKDFDKALSYYDKVLQYHRENENKRSISILLNNIGNIYSEQEQFSKALKAHQEALDIREELGDLRGKASSLMNIGNIYLNAFSDYQQSLTYAKRSLKTCKKINSKEGTANAYLVIAKIYQEKREPEKAVANAKKALEVLDNIEELQLKKTVYEILANNYEALGDYKNALIYFKEEQILTDSLFSQTNRDAINELTQKYKFEQQEQTIYTQELKLEKQDALLDRQSANRLLLIGVIAFLSALGVLSFYFIRQKQQANQQLHQLNEEVNAQNDKLTMAHSRLKVANQDLQSFTQMASHDLKEPLRMMGSFASLLKRRNKNLDESSQEYIGFITEAAGRMTRMLNDMLSYATNNIQVENMEYLNMNQLMITVQQNLHVVISENNAEVMVDNNLPEIKGQASLIEQVFQNLISNAIKFQQPNTIPKILITAQTTDNQIIYKVMDNGIGIALKNQSKVFQLFKRFNEKYEGSGIGLTTCKKIIELHQGTIELESEVGKGTNFILTFPK